MKRRGYAIAAVTASAVIVLTVACIWFGRGQPAEVGGVALAFLNQGTNQPAGQVSFRLYNDGPRAIWLGWMIVETNSPTGWRSVQKTPPNRPSGVAPGKSSDLLVSVPPEPGRWRLRVVYAKATRGPVLFLTRAQLAIKQRSWSGWSMIGVFIGSNSVTSEVSQ